MSDAILEVKNLSFSYDGKDMVLKNISLEIKKGEKIALLGANGAGKSTFFLNINGVYERTRGDIFLHGEKICKKNINSLRKSVGVVFQEPDGQIVASTVKGDVAFGPVNLRLSDEEVEERTNEAINSMNLSSIADRPPHYLSGGEKKRVGIAGVLAMKPEIILFDEPAAFLDAKNATMFEKSLAEFEREGKSLVVSTHDVDFAYRWADRAIVFNGGSVISDDVPINIFTNERVLNEANLSKPILLQVCEAIEDGWDLDCTGAPRSIDEFKRWLDVLRREHKNQGGILN